MRIFTRLVLVLGTALMPLTAAAQEFPQKAVTLVIPVSPGSSSDILGRFLADGLSKRWGQPVVVENRPGAESVIGSARVATAKPDGYTLLSNSTSLGVNAALAENMPFDPFVDLRPIAVMAKGDFVMLTGTRVPLTDLQSVAETAKTGKVFAGITGGVGELVTKLFEKEAGIEMEPVQYKSPPEALLDLGGGRIDFFVTSLTTYLASASLDKSNVVAVTSRERAAELPDVPTAEEAGYPNVVAETWWGIFAPGGLPDALAEQINADISAVMTSEAAIAFLTANRTRPFTLSASETVSYVHDDMRRTKEILAGAN